MTPREWLHETAIPILVVILLDLAITIIFLSISGKSARIGTFRPPNTVPPKIAELAAIGIGLGVIACISRRKPDPTLLTLSLAFVLLLDADHLPSLIGIAQPIRPAHSFAFLVLEVIVLSLTVRRRPEVQLMAVAAFFGHTAGDSGEFALFAPFSFDYSSISAYDLPLAIAAIFFALAAGYAKRRNSRIR
jgi:hypothetical protein